MLCPRGPLERIVGLQHDNDCRLQVTWHETSVLRDASEHARANFLSVMKGEDIVLPAFATESSMRPSLPLYLPADAN